MSHHHTNVSASRMGLAALLTLGFVIGEAIAGYFSHSLALFSDAGHNFADAAALGFSWYAIWVARKPAHPGMTYGYHRVAILAALLNAVSLVIIALLILWQAIERLHHPEIVHGWLMIVVAAVAIGLNLLIGFWLHAGSKHDINVRSAYVHMIGDAISAMGVVIAGIIVVISGWQLADPIVSFVIAGLILWSCWGVLRESVSVLLEATPLNIDMGAVENCIRQVRGVLNVHDLHVWTVGPGAIACSCHIMVGEQSIRDGQQILRCVVKELEHHHAINHTTVQVEVEGHESNEMYCTMRVNDDATHAGHQH